MLGGRQLDYGMGLDRCNEEGDDERTRSVLQTIDNESMYRENTRLG